MGALIISIKIPEGMAQPPFITIQADGSISPDTGKITNQHNITYTVTSDMTAFIVIERDHIEIQGSSYTLSGNGTGRGVQWAKGYDLRSVSPRNVDAAVRYVRTQGSRHPDRAIVASSGPQ